MSANTKKKTLSPISWDDKTQSVKLLDQRKLPYSYEEVEIETAAEMAQAIKDMVLRGAPLIGIAAAYGMALAAKAGEDLAEADKLLRSTRPTAVNLMWALDQIQSLRATEGSAAISRELVNDIASSPPSLKLQRVPRNDIYEAILEKAKWIHEDDIERCKKMSRVGAEYIKKRHVPSLRATEGSVAISPELIDEIALSTSTSFNDTEKFETKSCVLGRQVQGMRSDEEPEFTQVNEVTRSEHNAVIGFPKLRILTHCNAGALATGGYGTALGVIRTLHEEGLVEMVYSDETRPRQQGSRLTAWELAYEGIPVTMISDGMPAHCMQRGMIDLVIVGSDRITANGDVANKIGTYQVAIAAKHHRVPFYVAAPESTIDRTLASGDLIPIEERDAAELHTINGDLVTAATGVGFFNPGFDVTPNALVEAIFTEKGVFKV